MLAAERSPFIERVYAGTASDSRRSRPPEETFASVMRFAPLMGITRVANVTGLDTIGIPVYTAHRPNSRSLAVTQGKGRTHAAAKVSALMEAVEAWHAERIDLPLILGSHIELDSRYEIADVEKIPRDKDSVFTPHSRILWIEAEDLLSGQSKLVPYETVHLDYRSPFPCGHGCFVTSSNGLASGNNKTEAFIHALCEVVERDSLTLWHLKNATFQMSSKVDLGTVDDLSCQNIIACFKKAGVNVGVWDITSDIGIPAFLCRILSGDLQGASSIRPASGMGCHLSKHIALSRALTEAAQARLTFISGVRDDMPRADYQKFLSEEEYRKWNDVISASSAQARDFRGIDSFETDNLKEDLQLILQRLRSVGIQEVMAIDLSRPEFDISVVRVVVPGLETALREAETIFGERAEKILKEKE